MQRITALALLLASSLLPLACGGANTAGGPKDPAGDTADKQTTDQPPAGDPPKVDEKPADTPKAPAEEPAQDKPAQDKPAEADVEAPKKPSIACDAGKGSSGGPKLAVTIDRAKVDLDAHKLEVKLTRPACKVELTVVGESGKVLAETARAFNGAAAGSVLTVDWSPIRNEPIAKIEVWGYDTDGHFVGVAITPWNVKIDHEEVNFETDSDAIRSSEVPKLEASLDKIKAAIDGHKDLKGIQLFIAGHTDTVGSPDHNLTLSRRRAKAIATWFRGRGLKIPVAFEGFGEHVPLVKTADETAEAKNRRVDYILSLEMPRLPQGAVSFSWKGL